MKTLFLFLLLCSSASAQTMYLVPPAHDHTEAVTSDPQTPCWKNQANITYNTTNGKLFACIGPPVSPAVAPFGSWIQIGGLLAQSIVRKTANYTLTTADSTVLCDASGNVVTFTLPSAPLTGQIVNIKKIDTTGNACTVNGNGKQIEGSSSLVVNGRQNYPLQYDGSAWWIL